MAVTDKVTHFRNEQILDALEALEGRTYTLAEVKHDGRMDAFCEGTVEFYWKGKLAIVFMPPEIDSLQMLSLECIHVYDNGRKTNINEHNKGLCKY